MNPLPFNSTLFISPLYTAFTVSSTDDTNGIGLYEYKKLLDVGCSFDTIVVSTKSVSVKFKREGVTHRNSLEEMNVAGTSLRPN
jgi:hypothetical protein